VRIVLLDEAQRRFEAEDAWWRASRDSKDLFVEEFAQALEQVSSMPETGQRYRWARGKLIQRLLMKKTRCHIYYFHDAEQDLIEVRPRTTAFEKSISGISRSDAALGSAVLFRLFAFFILLPLGRVPIEDELGHRKLVLRFFI